MKTNNHIGPKVDPPWWDFLRQLVVFLLGISIIIYATVTPGYDIPFLITGLVLLGIVPIERALEQWANTKGKSIGGSERDSTDP